MFDEQAALGLFTIIMLLFPEEFNIGKGVCRTIWNL